MSLLSRLRSRLVSAPSRKRPIAPLAEAERLLRSGGSVEEIQRIAALATAENSVERAWKALFLGDIETAQTAAYAAADERPYDVESRIVHGTVRLARNELDHAAHEFDAVIEEFGAEPDAADGRRAAILARGFAPLDELPASGAEWESAATLLTTLWRITGLTESRLADLHDAHSAGLSMITRELAMGQSIDSRGQEVEAARGSV